MCKDKNNLKNGNKISDEQMDVSGGIYDVNIENSYVRDFICPVCSTKFKCDIRLKSVCMCPNCGNKGPFISLFKK